MSATVAVRERPLLMSGEMVRAILDGRKTQTRRIMKPQPLWSDRLDCWLWDRKGRGMEKPADAVNDPPYGFSPHNWLDLCPYGAPGDRLWVRETWCRYGASVIYRANYSGDLTPIGDLIGGPWKPSIHMPRWASRLTLEITDVRVQRVQEITDSDALAEGVTREYLPPDPDSFHPPGSYGFVCHPGEVGTDAKIWRTPQEAFASLWDSRNAKRPGCRWADSPWVWARTFRRVEAA
jgi:hypothetical protein